MKTLKQLREEYNDKFMSQVEVLPEELMLEKNVIPSTKEMPSLLIFRRVSFRSYPKGQVVALYYSKTMDKYLSVPIGPGNSVNLSESVVSDSLDEACWKGYKQYGMKKKGGKEVPNCVPVEEDGPVMSRYTERPTYEHFKDKVQKLRNEDWKDTADTAADVLVPYYSAGKKAIKGDWKGAAKDAATDTALMAVGGPLTRTAAKGLKLVGKGAKRLFKGGTKATSKAALAAGAGAAATKVASDVVKTAKDTKNKVEKDLEGDAAKQYKTPVASAKHYSSWEKSPKSSPVSDIKTKQAELSYMKKVGSTVKENSISDIRDMIKEGIDSVDFSINGRQVTLNTSMAKRILEVYDSVNIKNKKIVESMLNEDLESFKKLINFSIRN